jgi:ketosteroid isomerase-like protein
MAEPFDAARALEVVQGFNRVWMARDLEAMKSYLTEDFIQWHSHIRKNFTKTEEFELLEVVLETLHIVFHDAKFTVTEDGVLQQVLADVQIGDGPVKKNVPFAMVYRVRGDKICRCDEYVDSASLPTMDFLPEMDAEAAA